MLVRNYFYKLEKFLKYLVINSLCLSRCGTFIVKD